MKTFFVVLVLFLTPYILLATPISPNNLLLTPSTDSVTLTWNDNSNDERGFKIFRDGEFLIYLPKNTNSYTDSGLAINRTYTYEVKATDDFSENIINTLDSNIAENNLTIMISGNFKSDSNVSLYINIDNNTSTGFSYNSWNTHGADYMLHDDKLYSYRESTAKWDEVSNTVIYDENGTKATFNVDSKLLPSNLIINYIAIITSADGQNTTAYATMKSLNIPNTNIQIGVRNVNATPLTRGTLFASPDGDGNSCDINNPCTIKTASKLLQAGDVLFLRGGTYERTKQVYIDHNGTKENPIIIESFPGELAILKGEYISAEYLADHQGYRPKGIRVEGEYIHIRKLEILYMGDAGISLQSSHALVEGCHIHDNRLGGIALYSGTYNEDDDDYVIPYPKGYNIVRDNIIHDNSDVGDPANGGNSDGIWIGSGKHNIIMNNLIYANSDDGIDTWRSNDTYLAYNISYDNGREDGDGMGFKTGGNLNTDAGNGRRCTVVHNISYNNKARGFDYNAGINVLFKNNTSYNNEVGYRGNNTTAFDYNIAYQDAELFHPSGAKREVKNSWNSAIEPSFISLDPSSIDFLRPTIGSEHEDIGAYAYSSN